MSRRAMHERLSFRLADMAGFIRAIKGIYSPTSPVARAAADVTQALKRLRSALAAEAKSEAVADVYFRP